MAAIISLTITGLPLPRAKILADPLGACLAALIAAVPATAEHGQPVVQAERARAPITVDGRLDEEAWGHAPAHSGFRQRDPNEGEAATEPTELRLLYDEDALYVGVRLHDREAVHLFCVETIGAQTATPEAVCTLTP